MFMKEEGIKIEIQKELMYSLLEASAFNGNKESVETRKNDIIKFLFPESKTEEEKLFNSTKEAFGRDGDRLRISVDKNTKLDPTLVNRQFNSR